MIVVLNTPSVAQRLAKAKYATEAQERSWTSQAYAAQQQVLTTLATLGVTVHPDFSYSRVLDGFAAPLDGVRDASEVPPLLIAVHSFGASPSWLGTANILVAVAAVGLLAIALYTSGRARLTGALVTLGCVAVALTILARGGIPPVIVYPIAAILGVRLLFWRATGS